MTQALENVRQSIEPFVPPWWCRSGHAQTIVGHLTPSPMLADAGERHEVAVSDGDRLAVTGFAGRSDWVVSLFHGLGGEADADYMHRTARICLALGHTVFLVNHRGCGWGRELARLPYHSGRGEDVSSVIQWSRKKFPGKKQLVIGFSLSGSAVLNLVTGRRGDTLPDSAISVNAPIALEKSAQLLKEGFNRVYDVRFVHRLRRDLKEKHRHGILEERIHLSPFSTVYEFDEIYTSIFSGFRDRAHYYSECSTRPYLKQIRTPTVLLSAADDPFVDGEDYRTAELSPSTVLHLEKFGGYMGYLSGAPTPLGSRRWLDYALNEYVKALTA
jgi:predicted alpha/beta-fold hydrolase